MKKSIAMILALILSISIFPQAFAADSYDYLVEAEAYTKTNFGVEGGSTLTADSTLSGGQYMCLYKKSSEECYLEYSVEVAQKGVYDMFLASSPVVNGGWSSPIYILINGEEETGVTATKISSTGNSRIAWYSVGAVMLNKGTNTIKFAVREKVDSGYFSAFVDCFAFNLSTFEPRIIDSDAPLNVFEEGNPITLWLEANAKAIEDKTYTYTLTDIYGNTKESGNLTVKSGEKRAYLTFENLTLGYYDLQVGDIKRGFSIVKPLAERKKYRDTPFATDALLADMGGTGTSNVEYAKVVGLSGVSWVRDRIRMNTNVTYADGKYTFSNYKPADVANKLAPYGIKVLNTMDYMPENFVNDYGKYIPDDLIESYNFWKSAATYFGDSIDSWEIFNEVDRGGTVGSWDSPDLYAAFMKAAAIGINDGSEAMVAVQGAAEGVEAKSEYAKMLMRNGVFQYSSIDNTHHHKSVSSPYAEYNAFSGMDKVPNRIAAQKELDTRVSTWVTEAGITMRTTSGVDLTKSEQLVQAKYLVTSTIESIASGTDKHFFFVGPSYREGEIAWGMMSEDSFGRYMYASLPAQATMTFFLGEGKYKGQINKNMSNLSAYLFNNGEKDVVVAWSKSGNQSVNFAVDGKVYDIWGNEKATVSANSAITVGTEPLYIVCDECREFVTNNRDGQMIATKREYNDAQRVILLQKYSDIIRGGSRSDGYMISDGNNKVTLEVVNLSDKTMSGQIRYTTENGWKLNKEYEDVTVAPMSVGTVEFEIIPSAGATVDYLSFIGEFDGQFTSPSAAKVVKTGDGVISLEAETDAKTSEGFSEYTQGSNKGLGIYTQTEGEYAIEFDVVTAEKGTYDLWALAGVLNDSSNSNYTIKVNGKVLNASSLNTTDTLYTSGNYKVGWNSFTDVALKEGLNKIVFSVSTKQNSGENNIVSALDKIVFMPKNLNGYREAENFTTKTGLYYVEETNGASGGVIEKLFTYGMSDPIKDNQMVYDFAIETSGNYDVWVLSLEPNASWLTKWKYGIDDGSVAYPSSWGTTKKSAGFAISDQDMYWVRVKSNVSLNRGIHTVTIRGDEEREKTDGKYMLHFVDAVVVVPYGSYSTRWSPSTNVKAEKLNILQKTLLDEYDLNNITGNITLPEKIDDVAITWTSSNTSVVSTDGTVNRPENGSSDASVTLTANFNLDGTTKSSSFTLKVKAYGVDERKPEIRAELEKMDDGYSKIQLYAKNTDTLADENGNMPAAIVAKYSKANGSFLGFVGEQTHTYTNESGDTFQVDGNNVTCQITGINKGNDVTFAVYKNGTKPGKETIAYLNDYTPTENNSEVEFNFTAKTGDAVYRVVINKNGEATSKIIHVFENEMLIYDEEATLGDILTHKGMGRRIMNTKNEAEMTEWYFATPENDEDVVYKVLVWEWYSMKPIVVSTILND